jgi:hypothetical protein
MLISRLIKITFAVVVAIFAAVLLLATTISTRTRLTCTLCRAERTDRTFLGYSWQQYQDTEFSGW